MRMLLFMVLLQPAWLGVAQVTGKVSLPHAGVEFTIPQSWVGQQTEAGYILGSQTEAGAIFLLPHQSTSLEALKQEALKGVQEDGGTQLMVQGAVETIAKNSIGANYTGTLQGQHVSAYAVGLINPYGQGVTILAVSTPEAFGQRHRQLAQEIAQSMRFSKAEILPVVDEWRTALTNARLTYMESYNTSGGGYSDKIVIELCAAGYFTHSKNYSMGLDTGGAFASDNSNSKGAGSWQVVQDAGGNAILELTFQSGEVREYTLEYVHEKTLLNGTRYFRTYDTECR